MCGRFEIWKHHLLCCLHSAVVFLSSFKQDVLEKLTDEANKDIITMGDFNADVIASKPCKYTRSLIHATRLHGLSQLVKEPTRVTEHTKTAIDLVFVNNLHRIVSHGVQDFAASDHSVVFAVKKAGVCKAHAEIREVRSFKRYNKEKFRSEVAGIPWSVVESFDDLNDAVSAWNTLFIDVANRHAPIKKLRTKCAIKPWITKELKDVMAERDYAYKVAKRSGGKQEMWDNYRKLKNLTNRKIKAAEALYYKKLIESAQGPKEMWRTLNSALGNEKVENLTFQLQEGERIISEPKAVASKFNKFFATIGCRIVKKLFFISKDAWKKYESAVQTDDENLCELQCVSSKVVSKILHSLKVNKAAGLDKIPARLVRDAEAELAPSITYLINKSITDANVPALWKVARVTPLYKAEDKLLVENYRPISVLPVLSKVLERVMHTQMSAYLDHLGWLYKHQYGFRRGRSTAQAVGQLNNSVLDAIDGGKVAGMLFLDISKAFDSINHKLLLGKLEHIGLAARSLRWFKSYLADRRQCVCINGEVSETRPIDLGVPQGSILGPLLFNVYINSLSAAVTKSELILYADAVLIVVASTPQELTDALRHDFTLISDWYTDNKLTLNVKKTKLMLSGSKTMLSPFNDFQFSTDEGQIDRVSSFKYLGVLLDEKWKWKVHVNSLLQKLGHRLSVFNRIYHMLDQKSLTAYFNGLVLPHLDYADIVWGDQPGLTTQMKQLQSFQNRFAKKIVKSKVSSAEALASLRWVSLHARRFGHRCCVVQDAMKGSIPEHFGVFRSTMNQQHGYNTRNGYMPKVSRPRTEWGRSKTYYKAINDWATLPSALKKLMPKTIFKYKLKQFLLNHF